VLGGERAPIAMAAQGEGWYEARVAQSPPGTRYAYRIDGAREVPDPASRWNPDGVHAPSAVVDPLAYPWRDGHWRGRPWEEAVVYELHVGAFTPAGSFAGVAERLRYLAELGVTALELMPVAAFAGRRNWGYDGVLPFAPAAAYGEPDDLRRLVDSAHAHGLMVLLDVVYNHFGPEGNYLHAYAPQFFDPRRATPWGAALDFDAQRRRPVRDFFIHNALYWLEEFHLDGLRLDAVHAIADDSQPHIVAEIAQRVRQRYDGEREVHLVLENDRNEAGLLRRDAGGRPLLATAQWNEDLHHALHVIATGEADGYYGDYAASPVASLGRALAEGFVYQGEPSAYRGGAPRGEASAGLPAGAFVAFAQNHDQIGNRALGERLAALAAADAVHAVTACAWLAPSPPLLFMGEEFGASTPFLFFCDFHGELAAAVTRGRRDEFARFAAFADARAREAIPDPNAEATFLASRLDWREAESAQGRENLERCRRWLELRRRHVLPFARDAAGGRWQVHGERVLRVAWSGRGGRALHLLANLSPRTAAGVTAPSGERVFATDGLALAPGTSGELPPFGVALFVEVTR
jgi:maltooligosyltrehalose trehalohydrolase